MTSRSRMLLTLLFAGSIGLSASACSGDKCEKVIDRMVELEIEGMAEERGDEGAEELLATMKSRAPKAVAACRVALEESPEEVSAALDCVLDAETYSEFEACPSF